MNFPYLLPLAAAFTFSLTAIQAGQEPAKQTPPIFQDNFDTDLSHWVVEQSPGGTVSLHDGKLDINDAKGCTVWFKPKLSGSIVIEYEATMISQGGEFDRVSDLNCFWMATDPRNPQDIFADQSRGGKFSNYDALRLYYVGYGANNNTTTRFRKYAGDGSRPNLPEHDLRDKKYLNVPNKTLKIRITCEGSRTRYQRDGETIFDFTDSNPLTEGWFGFRTVKNHLTIDNFRVYRLDSETGTKEK